MGEYRALESAVLKIKEIDFYESKKLSYYRPVEIRFRDIGIICPGRSFAFYDALARVLQHL